VEDPVESQGGSIGASVRFRCPDCRAVHGADSVAPIREFVCACGWRKPAGALPEFPADDWTDQTAYFREAYHARWKREQALLDADAQHERYRRLCLQKVLAVLGPGEQRVLEMGSGLGHFLRNLPPTVDVHAVDLSRGNLEFLRDTWCPDDSRGWLWNASVDALPFEDEQFDVVYALSVLWYVPSWQRGVAEMARVTRRGGTLVFDVFNGWSPWVRWYELYARAKKRALDPSREIETYSASPRRLQRLLRNASFSKVTIEGYYVLLPMMLPPFGRFGQLARRSPRLSFGLARTPLRWTGGKLLVTADKA
jgi:ubiquinone/menaquinone biosynthesis C-methylase UbiE